MDDRIIKIIIDSFWYILLPGIKITIPLTLISFIIGVIIAIFTAIVQVADLKIFKQVARLYVWIIRGTPLIVQLYVIFYGLPGLGVTLDAFTAAIIVFSVSVGAYASETIRAAIESIPKGQIEAGYCVGMTYPQIMRRIVLPQALRAAFPPLSNSLIGLVKDTSLAANITVTEMFMATQRIAARTYEPFILYCEVGVVYLIFCTVLTKLQRTMENRLNIY